MKRKILFALLITGVLIGAYPGLRAFRFASCVMYALGGLRA